MNQLAIIAASSRLPALVAGDQASSLFGNRGTFETAAVMANHARTRTTQLYDRRADDISLDGVERIGA